MARVEVKIRRIARVAKFRTLADLKLGTRDMRELVFFTDFWLPEGGVWTTGAEMAEEGGRGGELAITELLDIDKEG